MELLDTVIVRHGAELGVKSSTTRLRYDRLLVKNMKAMLSSKGLPITEIDRRFGRIYVKTPCPVDVARALSMVFGVSSTSPAASCKALLEEIADTALKLVGAKSGRGLRFAVKCRRVGVHEFTSMDVCRYVGSKILEFKRDDGWLVDLENPEVVVGVEVRDEDAFVYMETYRGVGGLPLGSQGRVLCLISGGIDSPVASWLAMRRGCTITLLHFNIQPFTGEKTLEKVVELSKKLSTWCPGYKCSLLVAPFGLVLKEIVEKCPAKLTCVLCKRMMLRAAVRVASKMRMNGIVTGDSIGEQASQTLRNMMVISEVVGGFPLHRPLLCFDKSETERLAREIGTYEISSRPDEGCKAAPKRPAIAASPSEVAKAEQLLDVESLIRGVVERLVELEV